MGAKIKRDRRVRRRAPHLTSMQTEINRRMSGLISQRQRDEDDARMHRARKIDITLRLISPFLLDNEILDIEHAVGCALGRIALSGKLKVGR